MFGGGTVRNCIVYDNATVPESFASNNVAKTGGTFTYCASTPLVIGGADTNNICPADGPRFVDASAGDYRLGLGSACIDAGLVIAAVTNDLPGQSRPQGAGYDMGAYEYTPSSDLTCDLGVVPDRGFDSVSTVLSAAVAGSDTNGLAYHWDFQNDGVFDDWGTGRATVSNTYGPGLWNVRLAVSNAAGAATEKVRIGCVYVAPSVVYADVHGSNAFPYETWAKAATGLQAAVGAALVTAGSNSVVLVSNGTFVVSNALLITKAIALRSVNGRAHTVLARGPFAGADAVLKLNSPGAVVDGFNITNRRSAVSELCTFFSSLQVRNLSVSSGLLC
jgi:hypothetical protein